MSDYGTRGGTIRRASILLVAAVTFASFGWPSFADSGLPPSEAIPRPALAIEDVWVVDVVGGGIIGPRTVLIVNGRIAAIEKPGVTALPSGTVRVAARGQYLIPGLVDMHVHLFNNASRRPPNEWAFPLLIANGITSVREMSTEPAAMALVNDWRKKVERGELLAPRVVAAGAAVHAESASAARTRVRESKAAGVDFLKVFSEVSEPVWRALLDEASTVQLPVCGHIPREVSLLEAAAAGQRSNEHLTQVYEACSAGEKQFLSARQGGTGREIAALVDSQERDVLESFDQLTCDRVATALARSSQAQVPTLVLSYFEAHSFPDFRADKRWSSLRADEQARWQRILKDRPMTDKKLAVRRWEVSRRIVQTLHAAGVPILAGTDAPMPLVYPGFALQKELELLVGAGLSPADALRAATIGPAEFLGQAESSGSVAAGKRADLVLLDGNPLADIAQTQRIRAVILDGRLLPRDALDALLSAAASGQAVDDLSPVKATAGDPAR